MNSINLYLLFTYFIYLFILLLWCFDSCMYRALRLVVPFDLEIAKTIRKVRKQRKEQEFKGGNGAINW